MEADEKGEVAPNSGSDSLAESSAQSSVIPAEQKEYEPVIEHDAGGNSRLPARIPTDADDEPRGTTPPSPSQMEDQERQLEDAPAGTTEESSTESDDEAELGPTLGQMEFIVPLQISGQARDQYKRTVKYNEELIDKFTGRKWTSSLLSEAE